MPPKALLWAVVLLGCGGSGTAQPQGDAGGLDAAPGDTGRIGDLSSQDYSHALGVETLSSNQHEPRGIAVDGQYIYWATASAVMRKKKSGGTAEILAGSFVRAGQLAVDSTGVFVVELVKMPDYAVKRIDKSTGQVTVIVAADPFVSGLAVDEENVYWACVEKVGPIDALDGQIRVRDKHAETPTQTLYKGFGVHLGYSRVTARPKDWICWTTRDEVRCGRKDGANSWAVAKAPHIDHDAHDIVDLGYPKMLAWTNLDTTSSSNSGDIRLYEKGVSFIGEVKIIADNLTQPFRIATDGSYLFWTDPSEGTIRKTAVVGPKGSTLLTQDAASTANYPKLNGPYDIAVDDHHVYWTNTFDGTVKRMPK
jgi:hypothetical protein